MLTQVTLTFGENFQTVKVCARDVILGLPVEAVNRIDFSDEDITQTFTTLLPSLIPVNQNRLYSYLQLLCVLLNGNFLIQITKSCFFCLWNFFTF